jgi:hypothetical protein
VIKRAWIASEGARCYHFCYHIPGYGQRLETIRFVIFFGLERLDLTKAQREDAIKYLPGQAAELMALVGERAVLVLAPATLVWQ